ncbi:hypothetical protein QYF36_016787 [Acer negundo]|nr:hypothetical protein QYF36_016787 [Acer negundo]
MPCSLFSSSRPATTASRRPLLLAVSLHDFTSVDLVFYLYRRSCLLSTLATADLKIVDGGRKNWTLVCALVMVRCLF